MIKRRYQHEQLFFFYVSVRFSSSRVRWQMQPLLISWVFLQKWFWKHQQACSLTWGRGSLEMDIEGKWRGTNQHSPFSCQRQILFFLAVPLQWKLGVLTTGLPGKSQIHFYLVKTVPKPETAKLWKGTILGKYFSCCLYLKWSSHENASGKSKYGIFGGRDDRVTFQYILIEARPELALVTQVEWGSFVAVDRNPGYTLESPEVIWKLLVPQPSPQQVLTQLA